MKSATTETFEKQAVAVFAENLREWMAIREFGSQQALADKAGLDQKTISNFLNPKQRAPSAKGKDNTPTLGSIEKVAKALDIPPWVLLRPSADLSIAEIARDAIKRAKNN